jgi:hypothetical protein
MLIEHGFLTISTSSDMVIKSVKRRSMHRVYCLGCGLQLSRLSLNTHTFNSGYHHKRLPARERLMQVHDELKRSWTEIESHAEDFDGDVAVGIAMWKRYVYDRGFGS